MDPPTDHPQGGGGQSTGEGHESPDRKGSIVVESTTCSMIYNTSLAAPGALAHRLHRRTACNAGKAKLYSPNLATSRDVIVFRPIRGLEIQNGRQGAPKWPTGSVKGSNPRLLGALNNFRKIGFVFCDPSTPSMRKGRDGGETGRKKKKQAQNLCIAA